MVNWKPILALAVVAAVVAGAVYALWVRDGGDDRAAFFALPPPVACPGRELTISVASAKFSAFLPGRQLAEANQKFLSVALMVTNASATPQTLDLTHVSLSDRPGHDLPASRREEDATTVTLAAGQVAPESVYFSVPVAAGAAKLTYDDGCAHMEWAVP